jgi:hypothetical protein
VKARGEKPRAQPVPTQELLLALALAAMAAAVAAAVAVAIGGAEMPESWLCPLLWPVL